MKRLVAILAIAALGIAAPAVAAPTAKSHCIKIGGVKFCYSKTLPR